MIEYSKKELEELDDIVDIFDEHVPHGHYDSDYVNLKEIILEDYLKHKEIGNDE